MTASTKAVKAKAAAKGFGGGGSSSSGGDASAPARVAMELSDGAFELVLAYNSWGSELSDLGAAPARGEDLTSFVGAAGWGPGG